MIINNNHWIYSFYNKLPTSAIMKIHKVISIFASKLLKYDIMKDNSK